MKSPSGAASSSIVVCAAADELVELLELLDRSEVPAVESVFIDIAAAESEDESEEQAPRARPNARHRDAAIRVQVREASSDFVFIRLTVCAQVRNFNKLNYKNRGQKYLLSKCCTIVIKQG